MDPRIQTLLRDLAPQVLGVLVRRFRDFAAAEDAVQEALLAASAQWPIEGLPQNPRGWLVHVAGRRLTDHVRSEAARRHREAMVVSLIAPEDQVVLTADEIGDAARDDTLELLFMCAHPVLSTSSAIALTLRAVGGLTTFEIARAFMVPEATMAQRISRAKQCIKASGVPFEAPTAEDRAERLAGVAHVLYLVFSEGYAATTGPDVHRDDLSSEALRLGRLLHRLAPGDREVSGLLALMILTDARLAARTGPAGELVPLDKQDRSRWDRTAIAEGVSLLTETLSSPDGGVGPYQVQAAIAALHDEAPGTDETDWAQILTFYEVLLEMSDNPMVALNHAVATAMVHGPRAGLARVDALAGDARLEGHHRVEAVRAHLFERAGERERAVLAYRLASRRTTSTSERDYLLLQAARLEEGG